MDWSRVAFTKHMTEAAAVVAECLVVLDFPPAEQVAYEIKVLQVLKGAGAPFFASAQSLDATQAFRPFGDGESPEEALQNCLESAGIHHRRRERQSDG